MREQLITIGFALYAVWIAGIVLALYLMWTDRAAARPVVTAVVLGSDGMGLVFVLVLIAHAAGVL